MPKNKNRNPVIKYLFAVLIGLFLFILITLIFSVLMIKTPYPNNNYLLSALLSIIIPSFVSSFIYCFKERKNGLISGLIIGVILSVVFFLIYTVFSSFNLDYNSLLIIPSSVVPAAIAGIAAVNIKRK